jgi:hypothetical protein
VFGACLASWGAYAVPTPQLDAGTVARNGGGVGNALAHDASIVEAPCEVRPAGCDGLELSAVAGGIEAAPAVVWFSSLVALNRADGDLDAWRGAERGCGAGPCVDHLVRPTVRDGIEAALAIDAEGGEDDEEVAVMPALERRAIPVLSAVPVIGTLSEGALPVVGAFSTAGAAPAPRVALGSMPGTEGGPDTGAEPAIGPLPRPGVLPEVGAAIAGAGAAPSYGLPAATDVDPGAQRRKAGRSITSSPQLRSVVAMAVPAAFALLFLGAAGYALWSRRRF